MREEQPEPFGALDETAEVAGAVEQVVDELPSCRLLLAYRQSLCPLVALGEGVDGLLCGGQEVLGRGLRQPRAERPGRREVGTDRHAQADARLRGPLPLGP